MGVYNGLLEPRNIGRQNSRNNRAPSKGTSGGNNHPQVLPVGIWNALIDRGGLVGVATMNKYKGIKTRRPSERKSAVPLVARLGTAEWIGLILAVALAGAVCGVLSARFGA